MFDSRITRGEEEMKRHQRGGAPPDDDEAGGIVRSRGGITSITGGVPTTGASDEAIGLELELMDRTYMVAAKILELVVV
ncbi:unnamed protein product [Lactuca virosa]|uniref:Uncharacterized protein n=1 Tax=Lactuca virosa TaxID=75947 RepID=A0AAU9M6V1_9ASTR|nr:unnamed protein product [Lactuca virosa]